VILSRNTSQDCIVELASVSHLLHLTQNEFACAAELIKEIPIEIYRGVSADTGNIGAHFRHNIEVADNYIAGLENGCIDYGNRKRDLAIETDPAYAIQRLLLVIKRLDDLPTERLQSAVTVVSEATEGLSLASSAERELEFLLSHTIHHHAIIAEKLRNLGILVPTDFGVALSTLRHWKLNRKH
jgi:hypothetical protein